MTVEILRYEAKWTPNSEWEECSHNDYLLIRQSIMVEDAPSRCRVIGVVNDSAGLLLPGPKGYETWREAAVNEKGRRVELERELKAARAEIEKLKNENDERADMYLAMYDNEGEALQCVDRHQQKLNAIRKILDEQ